VAATRGVSAFQIAAAVEALPHPGTSPLISDHSLPKRSHLVTWKRRRLPHITTSRSAFRKPNHRCEYKLYPGTILLKPSGRSCIAEG
jgi:hypothetical protein